MITTTTDGKTFVLHAESAEDLKLMHALDMHGMHLRFMGVGKAAVKATGFVSNCATLQIDPESPESHRAETARQVSRAFSQLISLGLREAAQHRHIAADATNPQAQEQLATSLVQLQRMLDAFGSVVVQQEAVIKKMQSAHGDALEVVLPIVTNGGVA